MVLYLVDVYSRMCLAIAILPMPNLGFSRRPIAVRVIVSWKRPPSAYAITKYSHQCLRMITELTCCLELSRRGAVWDTQRKQNTEHLAPHRSWTLRNILCRIESRKVGISIVHDSDGFVRSKLTCSMSN